MVEDVPSGDYTIPLGKARTLQQGSDITLVGWGAQVHVLQQAARQAAALVRPVSCEVIDLRTLAPWDVDAVTASVNKTGAGCGRAAPRVQHATGKADSVDTWSTGATVQVLCTSRTLCSGQDG